MQNEIKLTWKEHAEVCVRVAKAIRAGIAAVKHHKNYTSRVHDAIKEAIRAEFGLPVGGSGQGCFFFGNHDIRLWGFAGLTYGNPIYLCWNWPGVWSSPEDRAKHWSAPILAECDRVDMTDYIERNAAEAAIMPRLLALEQDIARAIANAREEAAALVATIPVPASATLRGKDHFWSGLTCPNREALKIILGDA